MTMAGTGIRRKLKCAALGIPTVVNPAGETLRSDIGRAALATTK